MLGRTLGHYRIIEKIGAGGMGVVYRAHDEQLERDVAIKILPANLISDEAAQKRFRKEALALAKLNHSNIATVFEFANADGVFFLAMEYIDGTNLADKIHNAALPEKEVVTLGAQIAAALEDAHEHKVIHCDLKPRNIVITPGGPGKSLGFWSRETSDSRERCFHRGCDVAHRRDRRHIAIHGARAASRAISRCAHRYLRDGSDALRNGQRKASLLR